MSDRRYSDKEVAEIFKAASEEQEPRALPASRSEGLTLTELQTIGREVGIAPEAVTRAALHLDAGGTSGLRRVLGLPIGVEKTVVLGRTLSDREWEALVVELRETFQAKGTVRSHGTLREWSNGNLQVLLEPAGDGQRIRLRTTKGSARAAMVAGAGAIGMSIAMAIGTAVSGITGEALPAITILAVTGIAMITGSAIQLPAWARLRSRQMDGIAEKLALPPG